MFLLLLAAAVFVGGLIGTVGVGGILLIPALSALAGLSTHTAMGTALFSFIFTGLLGTWLFQRHGSIDWRITIPVCLGGLRHRAGGASAAVGALVGSGAGAALGAAAAGQQRRSQCKAYKVLVFHGGLLFYGVVQPSPMPCHLSMM